MSHLPKLQKLNISGNVQMNLLDVRSVFESLKQLRALSIADITNMPVGIFEPLNNLESLNISGTHLGNGTNLMLEPLTKLKVKHESMQDLFYEWMSDFDFYFGKFFSQKKPFFIAFVELVKTFNIICSFFCCLGIGFIKKSNAWV